MEYEVYKLASGVIEECCFNSPLRYSYLEYRVSRNTSHLFMYIYITFPP